MRSIVVTPKTAVDAILGAVKRYECTNDFSAIDRIGDIPGNGHAGGCAAAQIVPATVDASRLPDCPPCRRKAAHELLFR
jgi:hypothetical protein